MAAAGGREAAGGRGAAARGKGSAGGRVVVARGREVAAGGTPGASYVAGGQGHGQRACRGRWQWGAPGRKAWGAAGGRVGAAWARAAAAAWEATEWAAGPEGLALGACRADRTFECIVGHLAATRVWVHGKAFGSFPARHMQQQKCS